MTYFFSQRTDTEKGVSLIVVFLIMTIMLAMVLGLVSFVLNQTNIIGNLSHSVSSFYAADTGIDKTFYLINAAGSFCNVCAFCNDCAQCTLTPLAQNGCNPQTCNNCQLTYTSGFDQRTFEVTAELTPLDEETLNVCIASDGFYKNTVRNFDFCNSVSAPRVAQYAYVANSSASTVQKFDIADLSLEATGTTDPNPQALTLSPDRNFVYVVASSSSFPTLAKYNASDLSLVNKRNIDAGPRFIAVSPDGNFVYTVSITTNTLQKFNASDLTLIRTIITSTAPLALAVSPDGNFVYVVTSSNQSRLHKFDAANLLPMGNVAADQFTNSVSISPDGNFVYTTSLGQDTLQKFNSLSLAMVQRVNIDLDPRFVLVNGSLLYVVSSNTNTLQKYNASDLSFVKKVLTDTFPFSLDLSADASLVFVAATNSNTVQKFNASDLNFIERVTTSGGPRSVFSR